MEVCSQNLSDPRTILLKVNGNRCNLSCKYCSELPKNFSKEQCEFNYESISKILERLPKNSDIILHGGEPTLIGLESVKKIIERIHDLKFEIVPSVQTNGYLCEKWVDFFDENREIVKVSVSIDGDRISNAFRMTKDLNYEKTFDKVDYFLHSLDKRNIPFRCIATINSFSWKRGKEIVNYFNQFNSLKFVRINPCFDIDESGVKEWAITPKQYLNCLKQAFKQMIDTESYKKYKLDPIMDILQELNIPATEYEFKCNKYSSVFPNGVVTSCDAMREVVQGVEIDENIFENFIQPDYVDHVISICNMCKDLSLCKGGCPPLIHRYELYDKSLVQEYCFYRVEIRRYIQGFLGVEV